MYLCICLFCENNIQCIIIHYVYALVREVMLDIQNLLSMVECFSQSVHDSIPAR